MYVARRTSTWTSHTCKLIFSNTIMSKLHIMLVQILSKYVFKISHRTRIVNCNSYEIIFITLYGNHCFFWEHTHIFIYLKITASTRYPFICIALSLRRLNTTRYFKKYYFSLKEIHIFSEVILNFFCNLVLFILQIHSYSIYIVQYRILLL